MSEQIIDLKLLQAEFEEFSIMRKNCEMWAEKLVIKYFQACQNGQYLPNWVVKRACSKMKIGLALQLAEANHLEIPFLEGSEYQIDIPKFIKIMKSWEGLNEFEQNLFYQVPAKIYKKPKIKGLKKK